MRALSWRRRKIDHPTENREIFNIRGKLPNLISKLVIYSCISPWPKALYLQNGGDQFDMFQRRTRVKYVERNGTVQICCSNLIAPNPFQLEEPWPEETKGFQKRTMLNSNLRKVFAKFREQTTFIFMPGWIYVINTSDG